MNSLEDILNRSEQRRTNALGESQDYVYQRPVRQFSTALVRNEEQRDLLQRPFAPEDEHYSRKPTTAIGKVFDFLLRGEYFAASILNSVTNEENETLGKVLTQAAREVVSPVQRYTMHDVIKNVAPEFVRDRPKTAATLAFAAGVALDPLSWMSFGTSAAGKIGVKGLGVAISSRKSKDAARFFETVGKNLGDDVAQETVRKTATDGLQQLVKPVPYNDDLIKRGAKVDTRLGRAKRAQDAYDKLSPRDKAAHFEYTDMVRRQAAAKESQKALQELGMDASDLIDQGGFKFAGRTLVTGKQAKAAVQRVADITGLSRLSRRVAELPSVEAVRKAVSSDVPVKDIGKARTAAQGAADVIVGTRTLVRSVRNAARDKFSQKGVVENAIREYGGRSGALLADEYSKLRAITETRTLAIAAQAQKVAEDLFGKFSEAERTRISEVLQRAQSDTYAHIKQTKQGFEGGGLQGLIPVSGDEFSQVSAKVTADEMLQRAVQQAGDLTEEQVDAIARWRSMMDEVARTERDLNGLESFVVNYTPVFHENFRADPTEYILAREKLAKGATPQGHSPGKARMFRTVEQARAAGYEPMMDILEVAAMRVSMFEHLKNRKATEETMKAMFGVSEMRSIPKALRDDMMRITGAEVKVNDFLEQIKPVTRVLGRIQGMFKTAATVLNPAFSVKQHLGAEVQRIAGGSSTLEAAWRMSKNPVTNLRDPMSLLHSYVTLARRRVPESGIQTVHGFRYTKADIEEMLRTRPVLKNSTVEGLTAGPSRIEKQLSERISAEHAKGKLLEGSIPEAKGFLALAKKSTRYTALPQKVEDANRLATFIDNLARGFDPDESYRLMERTHFNYSSGLTAFEDSIAVGLMPFYRFTKFATVLTANMLTSNPGRGATIAKTQRELMRAYGKLDPLYDGDDQGMESLTPAERHALPGFLFEQPTAFAGFDPELKEAVFRMFGGVNFLDFMNLVQLDDNGEWNLEAAKRTAVQGGMAQFTPFIKAPLELIFEKEFFTGFNRSEDGSGRRDIDEDRFFAALSGAVAAQFSGGTLAGAGAGAALGGAYKRLGGFELTKQLFGWERAVDPEDGVEKTYINPWTTVLAANFFPQFRTALGLAREDLNPTEHALKNIFGVSTIKLDLQDRRERKLSDAQRDIQEQVRRYRRLVGDGRLGRAEKARADLERAIAVMNLEREQLGGLVRGPDTQGSLPQ